MSRACSSSIPEGVSAALIGAALAVSITVAACVASSMRSMITLNSSIASTSEGMVAEVYAQIPFGTDSVRRSTRGVDVGLGGSATGEEESTGEEAAS